METRQKARTLVRRFAALLVSALLLASCSPPPPVASAPDYPPPSAGPSPESGGVLSLVTSPHGLIFTSLASAPDGFYEVTSHSDWTANIFYTDYQTKQKVYLSSQLSSSHRDETDESFIPTTVGGVFPACDGKYLYVFKIGKSELERVYGEDGRACIWRASLNGAGRLKMELPANMSLLDGSGIVSDQHVLYAVVSVTDEARESYRLVQIDIKRQTVQTLEELSAEQNHFLLGVAEDSLVMKSITRVPSARSQKELLKKLSEREHAVYLYNPRTGARTPLKSWKQGQAAELLGPDSLYFYTSDNRLEKANVKDGTLVGVGKVTFPGDFAGKDVTPEIQIFDHHIIFRTVSDQEQKRYAYDLITGELKQLSLQFNDAPLSILIETDGFFVVHTGDQEFSYADTAPDGAPITNTQLVPIYSLIQKEDYWNNRPNYTFISSPE